MEIWAEDIDLIIWATVCCNRVSLWLELSQRCIEYVLFIPSYACCPRGSRYYLLFKLVLRLAYHNSVLAQGHEPSDRDREQTWACSNRLS